MSLKEPVLLTVMIQTNTCRWFVGYIDLKGQTLPLIRSVEGDFDEYRDLSFDEQVSFLRHRFAGVLQQGCDKLWHHQKKPESIIFVADGSLDSAQPELSQRVAEHFATWMTAPPVAFFSGSDGFRHETLQLVAGELTQQQHEVFTIAMPTMVSQLEIDDLWQLSKRRGK